MIFSNWLKMIQEEQEQHLLFKDILKSLEKYNGQKISKRLETYLKKEFPDYLHFHYSSGAFPSLYVSENHVHSFTINLFENSDGILNTAVLYQRHSFGIHAQIRLEKFDQNKETYLYILEKENEELVQLKQEYKKRISDIKKKSLDILGYTFYFEE